MEFNTPVPVIEPKRRDGTFANAIVEALTHFNDVWDELIPIQATIIQLLVERLDVAPDGIRLSS